MIAPIEQVAGTNVTLAKIETGAQNYERESAMLEQLIADLERDFETVKQKHLRNIKRQAGVVANCEAELHTLIEAGPGLFIKPRTITIHGIKLGFMSSTGRLEFDDEETVIALIKKHRKDDADSFIRRKESVNKDALKTLDVADLRKLGCVIEDAGDVVVLKRVAGEVEKLINKLIGKLVEAMVETD
jgi:phage host-nuclease inhibitor protein Gam